MRTDRIANNSSGMVLWRFTMSDRAVVETMLVKASRSRQSQQAKSNQRSNRSDEGIMECGVHSDRLQKEWIRSSAWQPYLITLLAPADRICRGRIPYDRQVSSRKMLTRY